MLYCAVRCPGPFLCRKLECFKQVHALNILAWNNQTGLRLYLLVSRTGTTINRNAWGHTNSTVRGEILGFVEDDLL